MSKVLKRTSVFLLIATIIVSSFCSVSARNSFKDINFDDWFYESVCYCYENQLVNGTSTDEFSPYEDVDRGMFATLLYRLAGEPEVTSENVFEDVTKEDYFYSAVRWAYNEKVIFGIDEKHFSPKDAITREQMACMIARYVKSIDAEFINGPQLELAINDNDKISDYALDDVYLVIHNALMIGDDSGYFNPQSIANRAEIATLFMRLKVKLEGDKPAVLIVATTEDENGNVIKKGKEVTLSDKDTKMLRGLFVDLSNKKGPYAEYIPSHIIVLDNVEYTFDISKNSNFSVKDSMFNFINIYSGECGSTTVTNKNNMTKILEIISNYEK